MLAGFMAPTRTIVCVRPCDDPVDRLTPYIHLDHGVPLKLLAPGKE